MLRKPKMALAVVALAAAMLAVPGAQAAGLKHYDSSKKSFWEHPPADWFLGDETAAQKGLAPRAPAGTGGRPASPPRVPPQSAPWTPIRPRSGWSTYQPAASPGISNGTPGRRTCWGGLPPAGRWRR